ncbi:MULTISPECIES: DMT family transporter [Brevundimonas]|jgi:transporter family-2 protein|uniref:DMT family transporter n=1 Tax=Brevundimonas sp. 357 TaxID=2555782 RepID=UPI000F767205|nr:MULTISPECIES: DMT family transporter [Brevundimonas]RSB46170.1 DMT family transporter [Brevundimonas sp. 357]
MQLPVLALLAMILGGAATALQGPTNARLASAVGSPVNAALVSFFVGTVALALVAVTLQARPDVQAMKALPAWAWLGGLYGCVFVVAAAWGVPKIGVALTITLMVAGQLALSLILDHFGVMGVPQQSISLTRVAGVLLVIGGVLLVRRG